MTKNVNLRLDDDLHAQVKQASEDDERSLNGEIAWLLRTALEDRRDIAHAAAGAIAAALRTAPDSTGPAQRSSSGPAEGPNSAGCSTKR